MIRKKGDSCTVIISSATRGIFKWCYLTNLYVVRERKHVYIPFLTPSTKCGGAFFFLLFFGFFFFFFLLFFFFGGGGGVFFVLGFLYWGVIKHSFNYLLIFFMSRVK